MRVYARLVFVLYILFCTMVMAQEVKKKADPPHLTDAQKLVIRSAQVEMFQAKTMLESTPQYKAFVAAQDKMNNAALQVERESGCVPPDWQFTQELECRAVPKPEKK